MILNQAKIPKFLRELDQWVLWKTELSKSGSPTKVPYRITGYKASSTDPSQWTTFQSAVDNVDGYDGIGFVFKSGQGLCGIDFDVCRDANTGKIEDWAGWWIKKFSSYAEVSPSMMGVKIWIKGKLPFDKGQSRELAERKNGHKPPAVEAYDWGRFFATTGLRLQGMPDEPQERQDILEEFCKEYFSEKAEKENKRQEQQSRLEVIERARQYISSIPAAVAGRRGHDKTFHVACVLMIEFNLTLSEARVLLAEWNARCEPKWNEKELQHKLEDADKQPGVRGRLKDAKQSEWKKITIEERIDPNPRKPREKAATVFGAMGEGSYRQEWEQFGITMDVDRLRRENNELWGELTVVCDLPGGQTYDGPLSIADFNFSSARARSDRAKLLGQRSNTETLDWAGMMEDFCQRVLSAERKGQPSVDLRTIEKPNKWDQLIVEGLRLPRRHPSIIFGDGGAAKSYTALYFAGKLAIQGYRIALFDWELCGEDHRERYECLFGTEMPPLIYARCEKPLVHEMDRLRRIVKDDKIDYAIYDSIAFACDGPPEAAEVASRYFRSVRQIGTGSLHIAHVSKAENGDQKPFGSSFWHNGARSTWFAKAIDGLGNSINLGLFNRKSNLGPMERPIGFGITFLADSTIFTPCDPAECPDLADKLSVRQRLLHILRYKPLEPKKIEQELEVGADTLSRTVRRYKNLFVILKSGEVALKSTHTEADSLSGQ